MRILCRRRTLARALFKDRRGFDVSVTALDCGHFSWREYQHSQPPRRMGACMACIYCDRETEEHFDAQHDDVRAALAKIVSEVAPYAEVEFQ